MSLLARAFKRESVDNYLSADSHMSRVFNNARLN